MTRCAEFAMAVDGSCSVQYTLPWVVFGGGWESRLKVGNPPGPSSGPVQLRFTLVPAVSTANGSQNHLPAYFADYWGRESEFASLRTDMQAFHVISGPAPFDDRNDLASITTPTLVSTGRHDFICGLRWAQALFEGIPGSKLHVLDHSGHMGHLEEPEIFAEAVTKFVQQTA